MNNASMGGVDQDPRSLLVGLKYARYERIKPSRTKTTGRSLIGRPGGVQHNWRDENHLVTVRRNWITD